MLDWYRRLLALRRAEPELTDPRPAGTQVECDGDVVVMRRGSFTVLANFGECAQGWRLDEQPEVILVSDTAIVVDGEQVVLAPRSLAVVRRPDVGSGHGQG